MDYKEEGALNARALGSVVIKRVSDIMQGLLLIYSIGFLTWGPQTPWGSLEGSEGSVNALVNSDKANNN